MVSPLHGGLIDTQCAAGKGPNKVTTSPLNHSTGATLQWQKPLGSRFGGLVVSFFS